MTDSPLEKEADQGDSSPRKVPLWTSAAWTLNLILKHHRPMLIAAVGITLLRGLL